MANPIQREKMFEALAFFSANVRYAGQLKLYKLLYYLDLVHFRQTGRVVTGLIYQAWPMGPVPPELDREFSSEHSELKNRFTFKRYTKQDRDYEVPTIDSDPEELTAAAERNSHRPGFLPGSITPNKPYKRQYLTEREQKLANMLAEVFHDATAKQMSDISHNKFGPWRKALFNANRTGIERPEINLLDGVVPVGKPSDELPPEELRALAAEQQRTEEALK